MPSPTQTRYPGVPLERDALEKATSRTTGSTYIVFLWITDFDIQQVVQQPVDRFVFVKHQKEFHNLRNVTRFEQFSCKER